MYEEYFGLKKRPFSIVPDPDYFYVSRGHREALAHLLYGIQNEGGFTLLTGEIGAGKTTVCRRLLQRMPENADVAFVLNPMLTVEELLATICDEFGIKYPKGTASVKVLVARIHDYLLDVHERGRRAVVIIEEAQNLGPEVLEQVRLLTNLETNERKLLHVIMLGQPELNDMLLDPRLRQLSQRITARYHLGPLTRDEVPKYVEYRLAAAGLVRGRLFPSRTLKLLFRLTGGVPRLINVVCDRALLGAYVHGAERVDTKTLSKAAREVSGEGSHGMRRNRVIRRATLGFLVVLCAALAAYYYMPRLESLVKAAMSARANKSPDTTTTGVVDTVRPVVVGGLLGDKVNLGATTLKRPLGQSGTETREAAYAALFREWRSGYDEGSGRDVRDQARTLGLRCLTGKGGVADLRQINKPAVLTLVDEGGGEYFATLIALAGDNAAFAIGNEIRSVQLSDIADRWSGEYLLLWRAPPSYDNGLKEGARGPLVTWVEKHLALLQGRDVPANGKPSTYDRQMVEQVKRFQFTHGMVPDGILGPRTVIALSAAAPSPDPVLDKREGVTRDVLYPRSAEKG